MRRETSARQATAEDVQTLARAAGLELEAERAAALVPICAALGRGGPATAGAADG